MAAKIGLERVMESPDLLGKLGKTAVLCNHASVTQDYRHVLEVVAELPGTELACIFSPQHGMFATVQDNMIESDHVRHPQLKIPIYSLYSETRIPTPEMMAGIDTILVDLQHTGCRVYTFKYTLAACMRAAKTAGAQVIVLDRINPVGGEHIEGQVLQEGYHSFVGEFAIPLRHGLTFGECAELFNLEIGCDLKVVPIEGYQPGQHWGATKRPWLFTSPNVPTAEIIDLYPATVMLEGTNVSEGRGTTMPFKLAGAPYIKDEVKLRKAIEQYYPLSPDVGGVYFRPVRFLPSFQKWAHQECKGVSLEVVDGAKVHTFALGLAIIKGFRDEGHGQFRFRPPGYEYNFTQLPIDLILGDDHKAILKGAKKQPTPWQDNLLAFSQRAAKILIYDRTLKTMEL